MAVNQKTPKLSIALNGIVLTSNNKTSFVLINKKSKQKQYSLNKALKSAPKTFIKKINKTSIVFKTHKHYKKITLHPKLPNIIKQPNSKNQNVLANYIIATPIRNKKQIYGLQLNPRKSLNAFTTSLLQPKNIALKINNLSLTHPNKVSQALSLLLTQQSAQFTIRRNSVPRLINVSVKKLTKINKLRHKKTQ